MEKLSQHEEEIKNIKEKEFNVFIHIYCRKYKVVGRKKVDDLKLFFAKELDKEETMHSSDKLKILFEILTRGNLLNIVENNETVLKDILVKSSKKRIKEYQRVLKQELEYTNALLEKLNIPL